MAAGPFSDRGECFMCHNERIVYSCGGCSQNFCLDDLPKHRQKLGEDLSVLEYRRDELQQTLIEQQNNPQKHSLMEQVDKWEVDSINKIRRVAQECRQLLNQHKNEHILGIEKKLTKLTEELKKIRKENEFNEIDLRQLQKKFEELGVELDHPRNIKVQEEATPFICKISVVVPSGK